MVKSKRFHKVLQKISGRQCSDHDDDGQKVGDGVGSCKNVNGNNGLYIDGFHIPIGSIRNVVPDFNERGSLIFVDSRYELARKYAEENGRTRS